jgi:hypothetical protein
MILRMAYAKVGYILYELFNDFNAWDAHVYQCIRVCIRLLVKYIYAGTLGQGI